VRPEELIDLFCAQAGLVCTVGAGGKKTTLYRLAAMHPGRVALTSTVFIPPFTKDLQAAVIRASGEQIVAAVCEAARTHRSVAYTGVVTKKGRFEGVAPPLVQEIHERAGFDVTFVKADGARTRLIKAPADEEPQLPPGTSCVIPIVSATAIGALLSERIAHRPERLAALTDAEVGKPLTPEHVAVLLSSEEGLLKGCDPAHVVPLINMVDDGQACELARAAAKEALRLSRRFDVVVLASMRASDPVVEVVTR
jgi:probable selenium-dependent hydroxylase accessory protein YqeC